MEKLYSYSSSGYRVLIIGVLIFFHLQLVPEYTVESLTMYFSLGFYAIIFTLMKSTKWVSYIELMTLFGLIYFFAEPTLYYLLLMPIISFASSKVSKLDILLFSALISGFLHIHYQHFWLFVFSYIGVVATLSVFHIKFNHIEYLENNLYSEREKSQEAKKKLSSREMELENVLKMFMKSKELNEINQEDQLIKVLVESAQEFFDAHYACLYLQNDMHMEKYLEVGKNEKYNPKTVLVNKDLETDIIKGEMLQTVIYHQNQIWGVLRIYGKTMTLGVKNQKVFSPFSELDHELLLTYVDQVMVKMKEVKLSEKNEFLANYDYLTGVPNRRHFIERFEQFSAMAARGESFSVLLLDIDHFKTFNDQYGHDTGDAVLKVVAEALMEAIRDKYDVVARIGGEEFGILLLNPNDQTFIVADRIRKMISTIPAVEQITVSIGISYYGTDGVTWEELYNNADKALYYAKENGRNRVVEHKEIR